MAGQTTRLTLLRHGQTDWNAQRRFQGQADIELNQAGETQAEAAGDRLAGVAFDALYSSPLKRTLATARLVRPGEPILIDPRLAEVNVGTWAGLTWDEVVAQAPEIVAHDANGVDFRRSPTGETVADVAARIVPAIEEIALRHAGGRVLIVSHGFALNTALHALLGLTRGTLGSLINAHFAELEFDGRWRLLAHNVGA